MKSEDKQFELLQTYIQQHWVTLRRGPRNLLQSARDVLLKKNDRQPPIVYIPAQENLDSIQNQLRSQILPDDFEQLDFRQLPADLPADLASDRALIENPGLLYVPFDYCVPGGKFNSLFGWDSYWIVLGLLHAGEVFLAKSMVDDFLYEIRFYGKVLNANISYFLSRSQPPLLTGMILAVYRQTRDRRWLRATLPCIEQFYAYWMQPPHILPETGLSRYHDLGTGPAPEVETSERDEQNRTHYERVQAFFQTHPEYDYGYRLNRFFDVQNSRLTDDFYISDRSMRESGFDPSDRFGRFNLGVVDFNPVCLNALLYRMEVETAEILVILGEREAASLWQDRATTRAAEINRRMWNEREGLYFDYDFVHDRQREYPFLSTFYPLWAGLATPAQAQKVAANLHLFEAMGGLQTSTKVSGCQWDAPFGWAPLQMIAVTGLRNYGFEREACRIALNFLGLVLKEFIQHKAVFEKYDVVSCSSETSSGQTFGYRDNVVGFGWTNGVVLELLAHLPRLPLSGVGIGRSPLPND